jgi:hypothetical protein
VQYSTTTITTTTPMSTRVGAALAASLPLRATLSMSGVAYGRAVRLYIDFAAGHRTRERCSQYDVLRAALGARLELVARPDMGPLGQCPVCGCAFFRVGVSDQTLALVPDDISAQTAGAYAERFTFDSCFQECRSPARHLPPIVESPVVLVLRGLSRSSSFTRSASFRIGVTSPSSSPRSSSSSSTTTPTTPITPSSPVSLSLLAGRSVPRPFGLCELIFVDLRVFFFFSLALADVSPPQEPFGICVRVHRIIDMPGVESIHEPMAVGFAELLRKMPGFLGYRARIVNGLLVTYTHFRIMCDGENSHAQATKYLRNDKDCPNPVSQDVISCGMITPLSTWTTP